MQTPIILLQECHLKAVCALENICFSSPWNEEEFKKALYSTHFRLYGYVEKELFAYLLVSQIGEYCEIINIATNPNHRKKGYASQLLDNFFKQECMINTQVVLEVRSQNIHAQNLYKKFGFVQIHLRKSYYEDNGEDALVMERKT